MTEHEPLLVFLGVATIDTIALVDTYPAPDSRTIATQLVAAGGGPAATAAVAAARAGAKTAFIGCVGTDPDGDRILTDLASEGVDVSAVARSTSAQSGASVIVVARTGSTRTIITRPGPTLDLTVNAPARQLLAMATWVHVDHLGWPALQTLDRRGSYRLSVDHGNPIPGFTPAGADLYAPTLGQLTASTPGLEANDIDAQLRSAKDSGARTVVATAGEDGCWGLGADETVIHVPAVPGEIRSTLGAGDVFHGILVAALAAGYELPDAMREASATAGKSCQALDGRSGIPRRILYRRATGAKPTADTLTRRQPC